jgi:hypothetical protein
MSDKTILKPLDPSARSAQALPASNRTGVSVPSPLTPSEAVVNSTKPELNDQAAAREAQRLASSLSSAGSKGLDAIKVLDPAAIERLLSDD